MRGSEPRDDRLSAQQVLAQIRRARQAFQRTGYVMGSLKLAAEFRALDLITGDEQREGIEGVLDEISSEDYRGPHPPRHIAGEPISKGARMLGFVWSSARFRQRMYFKFCLSGKAGRERLVVLSLHEEYRPDYFEKLG
ncbi:MAG: hypothetical protein ABSE56_20070 [Bryobacteraceae bacterium]